MLIYGSSIHGCHAEAEVGDFGLRGQLLQAGDEFVVLEAEFLGQQVVGDQDFQDAAANAAGPSDRGKLLARRLAARLPPSAAVDCSRP